MDNDQQTATVGVTLDDNKYVLTTTNSYSFAYTITNAVPKGAVNLFDIMR